MQQMLSGETGKQYLKRLVLQTEELLTSALATYQKESLSISDTSEALLNNLIQMSIGGKKLRGALLILGYQLAGGMDLKEIEKLSLFVEIFHSGLLIHDDIMDRDSHRRGIDSMHIKYAKIGEKQQIKDSSHYGTNMAILAGDLAYYLSWRILMESNFPDHKIRQVSKLYSEYAIRLVYGQAMDISHLPLTATTIERILLMMKFKTAEYTGILPLEVGAIMGNLPEKEIIKLRHYGLAFGWAFQIQDDILGLYGDSSLGKPVGSDLREGKHTLLMLRLFENANDTQRKRQQQLMGKKDLTQDELDEMKDLLLKTDTLKQVKEAGWAYVNEAALWAEKLEIADKYKKILKSLVAYMMERTN